MNKSWSELENAFIHVARRIAEMCVPIDFDKLTVTGANEATEQMSRHDTESSSRCREQEFLDFAPALFQDESPHFNPGQNFVTTTDPLRNKWQLIFPIHRLPSLFPRDYLVLGMPRRLSHAFEVTFRSKCVVIPFRQSPNDPHIKPT